MSAVVGYSHKAIAPQIALKLIQGSADITHAAHPQLVSVHSIMSGGAKPMILVDDRFAHSSLEEAHRRQVH
jgi:hypothetical protein